MFKKYLFMAALLLLGSWILSSCGDDDPVTDDQEQVIDDDKDDNTDDEGGGSDTDDEGNTVTLKARGRHDPCVLPRAVPIVEAMAAIVMLDFLLQNRCSRL